MAADMKTVNRGPNQVKSSLDIILKLYNWLYHNTYQYSTLNVESDLVCMGDTLGRYGHHIKKSNLYFNIFCSTKSILQTYVICCYRIMFYTFLQGLLILNLCWFMSCQTQDFLLSLSIVMLRSGTLKVAIDAFFQTCIYMRHPLFSRYINSGLETPFCNCLRFIEFIHLLCVSC
jgi:hypothetical protein